MRILNEVLELINDFQNDLLKIGNERLQEMKYFLLQAFKDTIVQCIGFFEITCSFYTECITIDLVPTLYDFSLANFNWIPGRFADCFKESKYKRNFKNGIIY